MSSGNSNGSSGHNPNDETNTKQCLIVGTWNVRTLNREENGPSKLNILSSVIDEYELDLLGITETRLPGRGEKDLKNEGLLIYSGRTQDSNRYQGVGLSLSKSVKKYLKDQKYISERVMTARLSIENTNISVIVAYAPTNDKNDDEKGAFYYELSGAYETLPRDDIKLLLGDFNAMITSDASTCNGTIGGESPHSSSNDNGIRLTDFCTLYDFVILDTLLPHKIKGTWKWPGTSASGSKTVNQIDHICISKKFKELFLDLEVDREADIGSDHYLMYVKMNINPTLEEMWSKLLQALSIAEDLETAASKAEKNTANQVYRAGNVISDPSQLLEKWKNHFIELLNPNPSELDSAKLDYSSDKFEAPSPEEISCAFKLLKSRESPDIKGKSNKQPKHGEEALVPLLHKIFCKVWKEEAIPQDWSNSVIFVKGSNEEITYRSTASMIMQIIILRRLNEWMQLREKESGYRRNLSSIDQIYSLRKIIRKSIEYNIPLYITFVYFEPTFKIVERDFIWECLGNCKMPEKYIKLMKAFFVGTSSDDKVNGTLEKWFSLSSETGHDYPVFYFSLNFAAVLTEFESNDSKGAVLTKGDSQSSEMAIRHIDYHDSMVFIDNNKEGLQKSIDLLSKCSSSVGLKINARETKCMVARKPKCKDELKLKLLVNSEPIDQVHHIKYLKSVISEDGNIDRDICNKINEATEVFFRHGNILDSKLIDTTTKLRIYKTAVFNKLLYGCEGWNDAEKPLQRLEFFHQLSLRRILGIKLFEKLANDDVRKRAKIESVETFINEAKRKWNERIYTMPDTSLPKYLLYWKPDYGARSPGRPPNTSKDVTHEQLDNLSLED